MKNYVITITKDELDLDKTLDSGQAFRWQKDKDGYWIGAIKDKLCILKQYDSYISTNIAEEDANLINYYFNLDMNYTAEMENLDLKVNDEFAYKAYQQGKGIHILRQNYFETIVTFLLSSCNTMNNIRNIVNKLSKLYGDRIEEEYENKIFIGYTFPTLQTLSKLTISELESCRMGFRAKYVYEMCQKLSADSYVLDKLESGVDGGIDEYNNTISILINFKGIGDKVANCISLFAGHHLCAFPIDTHIKQIIDSEYNGYIDISKYKNIPGLVQQYLYYYKAF